MLPVKNLIKGIKILSNYSDNINVWIEENTYVCTDVLCAVTEVHRGRLMELGWLRNGYFRDGSPWRDGSTDPHWYIEVDERDERVDTDADEQDDDG